MVQLIPWRMPYLICTWVGQQAIIEHILLQKHTHMVCFKPHSYGTIRDRHNNVSKIIYHCETVEQAPDSEYSKLTQIYNVADGYFH